MRAEGSSLAIGVGNTGLAWCVLRDGAPADRPGERGAVPVAEEAPGALRALARALPVHVASVNPARLERLAAELAPASLIVLGRDLPIPIANETREPERVGADRLLAALGAWRALGPAIVVDFGTAITVNLVVEGPAFRGGAIIPGPRLWARALAAGTSLLPEISMREAPPEAVCGRDTREAIELGIRWGVPGAVRALVEGMRAGRRDLAIAVTGGGALPFLAALREGLGAEIVHDPDLLFKGIGVATAGPSTRIDGAPATA